ncbi:MAG: SGNH/GDSL hydrolase family protein [Legionella sp.]
MKFIFAIFLCVFSSIIDANELNGIVVFGDSLSDSGNLYEYMKKQLPSSPPYYHGRFTNGPLWIDWLSSYYFSQQDARKIQNFAIGGAGVYIKNSDDKDNSDDQDDLPIFTLQHEVDSYLLANNGHADPNSLYVFWIGANNYLSFEVHDPDDQTDLASREIKLVNNVINGTKTDLKRLIDLGAQTILVANLPDLGRLPKAISEDEKASYTRISTLHNEQLQSEIEKMMVDYPHVKWLPLDIYSIFHRALNEPSTYSFKNVIDACFLSHPSTEEVKHSRFISHSILNIISLVNKVQTNDICDDYLFVDLVHPSAKAHKIVANMAIDLLNQSNITFRR